MTSHPAGRSTNGNWRWVPTLAVIVMELFCPAVGLAIAWP
jgi:hypothetical protein